MYEDEPEVDHVERTRFPWQWFSQDIELLELKVRGDWAMVGVEKSGKQCPLGDHRGRTEEPLHGYLLQSLEHWGISEQPRLTYWIRRHDTRILEHNAGEEENLPYPRSCPLIETEAIRTPSVSDCGVRTQCPVSSVGHPAVRGKFCRRDRS